jgi:hypothetical protein
LRPFAARRHHLLPLAVPPLQRLAPCCLRHLPATQLSLAVMHWHLPLPASRVARPARVPVLSARRARPWCCWGPGTSSMWWFVGRQSSSLFVSPTDCRRSMAMRWYMLPQTTLCSHTRRRRRRSIPRDVAKQKPFRSTI